MIKTLMSPFLPSTLNLVINIPIFHIYNYFKSYKDWINNEFQKTKFETEIYLPKLLVKHNIFSSISQIEKST